MKRRNKIVVVICLLSVLVLSVSVPCLALSNYKSTVHLYNNPSEISVLNNAGNSIGYINLVDDVMPDPIISGRLRPTKYYSSFGYGNTYQGSALLGLYGTPSAPGWNLSWYRPSYSSEGFVSGTNQFAFGGYTDNNPEFEGFIYSNGFSVYYDELILQSDDSISFQIFGKCYTASGDSQSGEIPFRSFSHRALISGYGYNRETYQWDFFSLSVSVRPDDIFWENVSSDDVLGRDYFEYFVSYNFSPSSALSVGAIPEFKYGTFENTYAVMKDVRIASVLPTVSTFLQESSGSLGYYQITDLTTPEIGKDVYDDVHNIIDITYVDNTTSEDVIIEFNTFEPLEWLSRTVGNFLNIEIIPNLPLYIPLVVCLAFGIVVVFLKLFAGG